MFNLKILIYIYIYSCIKLVSVSQSIFPDVVFNKTYNIEKIFYLPTNSCISHLANRGSQGRCWGQFTLSPGMPVTHPWVLEFKSSSSADSSFPLKDLGGPCKTGILSFRWEMRMGSWFLASAWPSHSYCGHLGSEMVDGRSLFLSSFQSTSFSLPSQPLLLPLSFNT